MSDRTIVVSVEDLIDMAFGPLNKNTVNFKLIQTILHILARQMRLLEQDVVIKFDEIGIDIRAKQAQQADDDDEYDDQSTYTSSSSEGKEEDVRRAERERDREKAGEKKERSKKGGKEKHREQKKRDDKGGLEEKGEQKERSEKGGRERKDEQKERSEKGGREEIGKQMERDEKGGREGKGKKKEEQGKGEKENGGQGKTSAKDREGKVGSKDREGKGVSKDREGKGGSKDREGKESSRDRDGKEGSRDRNGKDREGRRDRRSPGKSPRGRKGDDDREEGGERGTDRRGERGGKHNDRKGFLDRSAARQESGTSITVTEASRRDGRGKGGSDKIFVAERGPASRARQASVGSIEVVTPSQFALLERAVRRLEQVSGPPPVPALPDNEKLRKDLAMGRASLSETMEAVQLNARVQAAERGLSRMAELLTQLAMAGALPPDLATHIGQMQAELDQAASAAVPAGAGTTRFADAEHGGTGIGRGGAGTGGGGGGTGGGGVGTDQGGRSTKSHADPSTMYGIASAAGVVGAAEPAPAPPGVTHHEMHEVLEFMKGAITKEIQALTARATHSADMASNTSRSVAQKLEIAQQIDARISNLFSQTADYAEQLSGFDSGLTTQMTSFQEQMTQMRSELAGGLLLLDSANNNAETAAIMDLSERYESLVIELDTAVHLHQNLATLQQQLSDELRSLVECVEMLREQKADRDEVLDGLRDKADMSRLAGLLYEKDFAQARLEIEKRLAKCYDKFHKQNEVWQTALSDLSLASETKAEIITLLALKESATKELNDIQEKLRKLEIMLGDPKAALLMRQLAQDAVCGACAARAVMPPAEDTCGVPRALPRMRAAPRGAHDVCLREVKLAAPDTREHTCHRWVGGSHTLMGGRVTREPADAPTMLAVPTTKFQGYGADGKMYMMEEDLQPCAECNKLSTDEPCHELAHSSAPSGGAGDQARG